MQCKACFDELDEKDLACPLCGEATEYFRAQTRARLWQRLLGYYALFAVVAYAVVGLLLNGR